MAIDADRVDNSVLALLRRGLHDHGRVWKTFDWDVMNRLHRREIIADPAGTAKPAMPTEEGDAGSKQLFDAWLVRR